MTLTTHAVVGAAAAELFPQHPVLAFAAGFASHFAADALPHWDYKLRSSRRDAENPLKSDIVARGSDFVVDISKVAFDFILGMGLATAVFPGRPEIAALGAFAGILPDPLQFAYYKFRRQPLTALQRFHHWCHTKIRLSDRPVFGAVLQIALIALIAILAPVITSAFV